MVQAEFAFSMEHSSYIFERKSRRFPPDYSSRRNIPRYLLTSVIGEDGTTGHNLRFYTRWH